MRTPTDPLPESLRALIEALREPLPQPLIALVKALTFSHMQLRDLVVERWTGQELRELPVWIAWRLQVEALEFVLHLMELFAWNYGGYKARDALHHYISMAMVEASIEGSWDAQAVHAADPTIDATEFKEWVIDSTLEIVREAYSEYIECTRIAPEKKRIINKTSIVSTFARRISRVLGRSDDPLVVFDVAGIASAVLLDSGLTKYTKAACKAVPQLPPPPPL